MTNLQGTCRFFNSAKGCNKVQFNLNNMSFTQFFASLYDKLLLCVLANANYDATSAYNTTHREMHARICTRSRDA